MKDLIPSSKAVTYLPVILPLFIIAISVAYYLVLFLPQKERVKQEIEKEKIRLESEASKKKEEQLQSCVIEAEDTYTRRWNQAVEKLGREDNTLPSDTSDSLKDRWVQDQELCVKKYK